MPNLNPDGTMQVVAPTQSAFGAPSASAPPPPMQAPQAQPSGGVDPSFAGAIMALIKSLASSFGPKSITQAKGRTDQAIDQASGGLGNEF